MPQFKIDYRHPQTGELEQTHKWFDDTGDSTAQEMAEKLAFELSYKGWHHVEELKPSHQGIVPKSIESGEAFGSDPKENK